VVGVVSGSCASGCGTVVGDWFNVVAVAGLVMLAWLSGTPV
jgi:hypothetical protein